ncbi:hypothetical protein [Paenibacillus sp. MMS18-CY102]|uniref:hypothetical protein n=1 Tax=Paenibacillus sp. MMS18-CY102 TaxID=2682849 RepID=UPI0013662A7B|nr:hypothetical protein [Paenibacillus sp. MMS18-CY102]MWC26878.1 hypothetical protein [Paenibacillus sp. MMS18-CY102]
MESVKKQAQQGAQGFEGIIEEIRLHALGKAVLHEMIDVIVTQGDRIAYTDGIKSLTDGQNELYKAALNAHLTAALEQEAVEEPGQATFRIGMKAYGRIIFEQISSDDIKVNDIHTDDVVFGHVRIAQPLVDQAAARTRALQESKKELEQGAIGYLHQLSQTERDELVTEVSFICYHMAPVLMYTNDDTFTNFYDHNNLIRVMGGPSAQYLFDDLVGRPIQEWTNNQLLYIYSLHFLLKSGPPARGEEFNGIQLTPYTLKQFLEDKYKQYMVSLSEPQSEPLSQFEALSIPEQAKELAAWRNRLLDNMLFYRKVNGLNLLKKELLVPQHSIPSSKQELIAPISEHIKQTYQLDLEQFDSLYALTRRMLDDRISTQTLDTHPLEDIVQVIVKSALEHTKSDIGMSRSLRNFRNLIDVHNRLAVADAAAWKQADYFCCVVPSDPLVRMLEEREGVLSGILKAISIRMQFNSWHYTPGNFPRELVPEDRHFYFPPVMPDTADWSDQHHRGHKHASVRYSIRSPHHLTYKDKKYLAFFDLRLMRQRGNPYGHQELQDAIIYTGYLREVYQALLDDMEENDSHFEFKAFTKEWYDRKYKAASKLIPV